MTLNFSRPKTPKAKLPLMSMSQPASKESAPWELMQPVAIPISLPPLVLIQKGWKETEHQILADLKDSIADMESAEAWELRKKITNPYECIFSGQDDGSFPCLTHLKPLSRSYFKMIEILETFGFWNDYDKPPTTQPQSPFTSAHICEGPGGFLQCTVEGMKERKIPLKHFFAMTLRPTRSHIPGWRRSLHFLRRHPEISLQYGADDTGDILLPANQQQFIQIAQGAKLFTADGGFDFSVNYGHQELHAFPLILASFTMGLQTLAAEGMMVIKLFDMYSQATQDLVLGSAIFFQSFCIYKPATSRPCNSERYFVGIRYKGAKEAAPWIQHLKLAAAAHTISPLTHLVQPGGWPAPVAELLREQIMWQEQQQIKMIDETLHFDKTTIPMKMLTNIRCSKQWCERFKLPYSLPSALNFGLT